MTRTALEQHSPGGLRRPGRRRASRGQGVAEFSLCAPIALMMLMGLVAFFARFGTDLPGHV